MIYLRKLQFPHETIKSFDSMTVFTETDATRSFVGIIHKMQW